MRRAQRGPSIRLSCAQSPPCHAKRVRPKPRTGQAIASAAGTTLIGGGVAGLVGAIAGAVVGGAFGLWACQHAKENR
jgi:hypothetical protein